MFCNICSMVTGRTVFAPCAPYAFVKLLFCGEIAIEGENVVIVGADNIAGEPKAPMLMSCSTTFFVCSIRRATWYDARSLPRYSLSQPECHFSSIRRWSRGDDRNRCRDKSARRRQNTRLVRVKWLSQRNTEQEEGRLHLCFEREQSCGAHLGSSRRELAHGCDGMRDVPSVSAKHQEQYG